MANADWNDWSQNAEDHDQDAACRILGAQEISDATANDDAQKAADSFWKTKNWNNTGFVIIRLKAGKWGFI